MVITAYTAGRLGIPAGAWARAAEYPFPAPAARVYPDRRHQQRRLTCLAIALFWLKKPVSRPKQYRRHLYHQTQRSPAWAGAGGSAQQLCFDLPATRPASPAISNHRHQRGRSVCRPASGIGLDGVVAAEPSNTAPTISSSNTASVAKTPSPAPVRVHRQRQRCGRRRHYLFAQREPRCRCIRHRHRRRRPPAQPGRL